VASSAQDISAWIREVHTALVPSSAEMSGAAWGPVTARHRTTRPDWFRNYDVAWAEPITAPSSATLDVVTASLDDLPQEISPPRISRSTLGACGEVQSLGGTPIRMTWSELGGEIAAWDPESGAAVVLRGWPPNGYDQVSPFRWLVHWSVVAAGGVLLHAACVGRPVRNRNRGVLLLGEAGYGKSTTALGCLTEGWVTCGDDAVAVFHDGVGWYARPVFAAIKTKLTGSGPPGSDSTGMSSPATVTWDINGHKRVHLLTTTDAQSLAARIELDALVVLTPDAPSDAPCRRIDGSTARTLIAPSTALPLPFDKHLVLRRIGLLASGLPAYTLPRRPTVSQSVCDVADIAEATRPRARSHAAG
jgi:hypothetical protein